MNADSPEVLARIEAEIGLVEVIARQMRRQLGPHVDLDDLRSAGREGLLHAARTYDPGHEVPFRRWANLRIKGAVLDFVRRQGGLPRRVYRQVRALAAAEHVHNVQAELPAPASPQDADAQIDDLLAHSATAMALGFLSMRSTEGLDVKAEEPTAEELAANAEMVALLRAEIAKQPEAERRMLERHYFDDVTLEEAAREMGLSKSWGSRLHGRAIDSLSRALKRLRVSG